MPDAIEADDLTKTYGSFTAVDGIRFRVRSGESFGLLGPNGAGKTTTIRMLYGFAPRTSGRLSVFGLDAERDWREIKRRIGVCQQDNSLDPDLSVRQNLEIFARYFRIPRAEGRSRADELLRFTELQHRADARVDELSGGMQRRLVLARALINRPEMLILDEPTTGLDPQARHQVWERLDDLKTRGLTLLLTTHYMEEASRLCDRIVIMDSGRILVEGRPGDLVREYVGREVIEVSSPTDRLREFMRTRELEHEDLGSRLVIYSPDGSGLFHTINESYCQSGCFLRMGTLEDVFLKLTGRGLRE